jgi:hypothetical protein
MRLAWIICAGAAAALVAAGPASAKAKHREPSAVRCLGNPPAPTLGQWLFGARPRPEWNGCSPPVYVNGEFIGQDPDPHVRAELRRDPSQGYTVNISGGGRK